MPRVIIALIVVSLLLYTHALGLAFSGPPKPDEATPHPRSGLGPRGEIENLFIVIIDGIRNSEAFDDPTHRFIPHIWNDLRPQGTIYTSFLNAGHTATSAGHAAITTGVTQFFPNTLWNVNEDLVRIQEEPSLFQYYRRQMGVPEEAAWIINGKGGMIRYAGVCHHPIYGTDHAPSLSFADLQSDDDTWIEAQRVIDTFHPSLTMINLADVDQLGHTGNWKRYTDAILRADEIVFDLCQKIWNDPVYDGNTAIIITSDHGRHLDSVLDGFKEHGCSCMGCRAVPFLAIGPGIRQGASVSERAFLCDIAPTVAYMLGFDAHYARGRVLNDLFVAPPVENPAALVDPAVASDGDRIHVAACKRFGGCSSIVYSHYGNRGARPGYAVLSSGTNNFSPALAASDGRVAVAWVCYLSDGACRIVVRESTDGGVTWGAGVFLDETYTFWEDLFPSASYCDDELHVVWTESRISRGAVNCVLLRDSSAIRKDTYFDLFDERPRCSSADDGAHMVLQRLDGNEKNFDIQYCFHGSEGWLPPVISGVTPGESLRPDLAVDSQGIHIVWGEKDEGFFRTLSRSSTDGTSWTDPVEIGTSVFGAWRPRVVAANGKLYAAWEGYDDEIPGIFGSTSDDGGTTWTTAVRLTPVGEAARDPILAPCANGELHLVWTKGFGPTKIGWRRLHL